MKKKINKSKNYRVCFDVKIDDNSNVNDLAVNLQNYLTLDWIRVYDIGKDEKYLNNNISVKNYFWTELEQ